MNACQEQFGNSIHSALPSSNAVISKSLYTALIDSVEQDQLTPNETHYLAVGTHNRSSVQTNGLAMQDASDS